MQRTGQSWTACSDDQTGSPGVRRDHPDSRDVSQQFPRFLRTPNSFLHLVDPSSRLALPAQETRVLVASNEPSELKIFVARHPAHGARDVAPKHRDTAQKYRTFR